jgi:hypothetical protein
MIVIKRSGQMTAAVSTRAHSLHKSFLINHTSILTATEVKLKILPHLNGDPPRIKRYEPAFVSDIYGIISKPLLSIARKPLTG